jgi:tetratricopeptide (TPR) repeat protein
MTAVSAYHTVPWIATNANEERSLARLKTLPLGMGRTEVVISTWYRQRGDVDNQRYWLAQALTRNPSNVNAIYLLAAVDFRAGRYESTVAAAQRAVSIRPNKIEFRSLLVQALYALGRYDEALPHLQMIADSNPTDVRTALTLGETYMVAGHPDQALATFARIEQMLRPRLDRNPNDSEANLLYGFTLLRENRADEAVVYLQKAVDIDPQSKEGHCFLGYALRTAGRNAEAADQFRACLTVNPEFSGRADVESWLATQ